VLVLCCAGLVAERYFGFKGSVSTSEVDIERDHANARALGNSLLVCLLVPWSLCLLSYTGNKVQHYCSIKQTLACPVHRMHSQMQQSFVGLCGGLCSLGICLKGIHCGSACRSRFMLHTIVFVLMWPFFMINPESLLICI